MSWRVANECAERRFGSAARKQIIMFLADKASDDGSGIWCSKGTIQRHTELGESTVKRTISDFLKEGILIETGRRPCKNGFTVIHRIVLARVMALESMAEPDEGTGSTVDPVQPEPGTGSTMDGVRGPRWTPNHPKTIHKPPTRKRAEAAAVEDERFEKIWAAYPKDRQRGKAACLARIAEAVKEGVDPDHLLRAVKAYAAESEGFTRSKVCFSDNWFADRRWQRFLDTLAEEQRAQTTLTADHHARLAAWVRDRNPMCKHITAPQVTALLAAGLVTDGQLRAAGLAG
ncbi:hypothetical protein M3N55_15995 [Roseibaca sp. V10]|uniref:Helix-turn-helix domain-containing protein n=1 Tax=Roseinatronobacter domitianus TaxID=2940293 RepID=A0ABT0M5V7_9RHOB|nr:hypothetical protein [Roseibaca domitiana]MCL1630219.1 hypothetical protein [Roseibaca domitiana]